MNTTRKFFDMYDDKAIAELLDTVAHGADGRLPFDDWEQTPQWKRLAGNHPNKAIRAKLNLTWSAMRKAQAPQTRAPAPPPAVRLPETQLRPYHVQACAFMVLSCETALNAARAALDAAERAT